MPAHKVCCEWHSEVGKDHAVHMVQVEMCYKTTTTMMQYSRYCEARAMMNETIGAWIEEHGVSFSAPYQQAFTNMITDNSPR